MNHIIIYSQTPVEFYDFKNSINIYIVLSDMYSSLKIE